MPKQIYNLQCQSAKKLNAKNKKIKAEKISNKNFFVSKMNNIIFEFGGYTSTGIINLYTFQYKKSPAKNATQLDDNKVCSNAESREIPKPG